MKGFVRMAFDLATKDNHLYMLVGGGGVPNFGDELIIEKWLQWVRSRTRFSNMKLVLELNHWRVGHSLGFDQYPLVFPSSDMSRLRAILGDVSFATAFDAGVAYVTSEERGATSDRLYSRLERTAVFHLHGGGYLNSYWPSHAFSLGVGCGLKEKYGTFTMATGLGLGPFKSAEDSKRVAAAAEAFDYFEVRDADSASFTSLANEPGLDDAFLSSVNHVLCSESALHVSLIGNSDRTSMFNTLSRDLVQQFERLYFWICTPQDAISFATFAQTYRHTIPLHTSDLLQSIPVGRENFMLTERFHPHLIGARLGFSGAFVSRNPYYDSKHGSVVSLGSGYQAISLGSSVGRLDRYFPSVSLQEADAALVGRKQASVYEALASFR